MITKQKVEVYKSYNGDIDTWARNQEEKFMNDEDWYLIAELVADIKLVAKGLASEQYIQTVEKKLKENCDSDSTIEALKEISQDR